MIGNAIACYWFSVCGGVNQQTLIGLPCRPPNLQGVPSVTDKMNITDKPLIEKSFAAFLLSGASKMTNEQAAKLAYMLKRQEQRLTELSGSKAPKPKKKPRKRKHQQRAGRVATEKGTPQERHARAALYHDFTLSGLRHLRDL
ncbi:hypothetical protein NMM03_004411 [Salmonella enterica]|nr:hypothetical protein [Salmonella enterica]